MSLSQDKLQIDVRRSLRAGLAVAVDWNEGFHFGGRFEALRG